MFRDYINHFISCCSNIFRFSPENPHRLITKSGDKCKNLVSLQLFSSASFVLLRYEVVHFYSILPFTTIPTVTYGSPVLKRSGFARVRLWIRSLPFLFCFFIVFLDLVEKCPLQLVRLLVGLSIQARIQWKLYLLQWPLILYLRKPSLKRKSTKLLICEFETLLFVFNLIYKRLFLDIRWRIILSARKNLRQKETVLFKPDSRGCEKSTRK